MKGLQQAYVCIEIAADGAEETADEILFFLIEVFPIYSVLYAERISCSLSLAEQGIVQENSERPRARHCI